MNLADIPFSETRAPEPPAPRPGSLFSGGEARRRWLRYWVGDALQGGADYAAHNALRLLPSGACSRLGALQAPLARRRKARGLVARNVEDHLKTLRPDLAADPAAAERALAGWWRNVSRVYAEFSVIDRLWVEGRIEIAGREHFEAALASGRPVVSPSVHLGNWEAIGVAMEQGLNRSPIGVYRPQSNRFTNRLIYRMRQRYGVKVFPPGQRTAQRLHRLVSGGHAHLVMFVDEERDNQSYVPLFGRSVPARGNAVILIKLARAAKAVLLPVYMLRAPGCRFRLTFMPPMELTETGDARADITRNIERISELFEPLICEHIEQWYQLRLLPPQ